MVIGDVARMNGPEETPMSKTLININPIVNMRKFYTVTVNGDASVTCTWGRIGTRGQSQTFDMISCDAARRFAMKKLQSKLDKGYEPLTATWGIATR